MPISQERMIALVNAGLALTRAIDILASSFASDLQLYNDKAMTAEELIGRMQSQLNREAIVPGEIQISRILQAEAAHFKANSASNRAQRRWLARKRAAQQGLKIHELKPAANSPTSMVQEGQLRRAEVRIPKPSEYTEEEALRDYLKKAPQIGAGLTAGNRQAIIQQATEVAGSLAVGVDDEIQGGEEDEALPDHGEAFGVDLLGKGDSESETG